MILLKTFLRFGRISNFIRFNSSRKSISYFHNPGKYPLVYRTLSEHLDLAVEKYGDREAIVSCQDQKRITFAEVQEKANRLASGILELGLKKGDNVGIWSPNTINWYISMVGLAKIGLTTVALNPAFQTNEMIYCFDKVKLKGIIAIDCFKTTNHYEILSNILPHLKEQSTKDRSIDKPIVIIDSPKKYQGTHKFEDVLKYGPSEINNYDRPEADDPCNIQFTSGTTGQPKAAVVSHHSVVNNGIICGYRNEFNTGNHRICVQNPFFHGYMIVQGISAGMEHGATMVLPNSGYNPLDSLKSIVEEKCTYIFGTPTMYVDLITQQKKMKLPISSPEYALVGAAPCVPNLYHDMKDILKIKTIKNLYGLTEITCSAFHSIPHETYCHQTETVGFIQDHTEAKVVDKNGKVVPLGTPGELYLRGYNTMQRYFGDDEKTKEVLSYDRWFKTGDKFVLYEDGYGQVVGRLKDMIIRGGENIFPKEIEGLLANHPDIIEAQVIGVPDERMGEELCAYIRTVQGKIVTQIVIKEFFHGKIAHFKIPRYVKVVNSYPTTATGKIQKFKLREMFINENNIKQ